MKKYLLILSTLFVCFSAKASHHRAGQITYEHISGYNYKIIVETYTNTAGADDCELMVQFGDGDSALAVRMNGLYSGSCFQGQGISGYPNTKHNIYEVTHVYDGPHTYRISINAFARNSGICHMSFSGSQAFYLYTDLVIFAQALGPNNSPKLTYPPVDLACVGECFEHNPGAADADGDSLYYSISKSYANGAPIPGYLYPPLSSGGTLSVDGHTGDFIWCDPTTICQYNVAMVIEEWKLFPGSNQRFYAGCVMRDMQIDVANCNNTSPQLNTPNDTCVIAGNNLNFNVTATDAEGGLLTLEANGSPFLTTNPSTFISTPSASPVSGTFNWNPNCTEVQLMPYQVIFKVKDADPSVPLVNFSSVFIRVIAPAPTGLTTTPNGSTMLLNWTAPLCNSLVGSNPLKKYLLYRKNSCDPWIPGPCETGVPAYTGYSYIGSVNAPTQNFTDNGGGAGLIHGINYSYLVVAHYFDGSQSLASANACAQLVQDIPIITNVSVLSTGTNNTIWTHWIKPIGNTLNLDTLINPPPYQLILKRAASASGPYTTETTYGYSAYWQMTDTGFVSTGLNTQSSAFTFKVELYSGGNLLGSSHIATSVFLNSTPSDNKVTLSWTDPVPWSNYQYYVYKDIAGVYTLIDSTNTHSYADSNLVNGVNYCYKILSKGEYSDASLPRPLFNWSQIKCETPVDLVPPCQPNFSLTSDCGEMENILSWTNPNTYCSNDAVQYNVYFSQTANGSLQLIYSTTDMNATTYSHTDNYNGILSIAGCYAVTAVDSFGNESTILKKICADNCPEYELPNVFSPNGDGHNDFFSPLPYRFVKDVLITIYDRWGLIMFETTDPDILWDGTNRDTKKKCPDGTYFYVCTVNEIHVEGIKPRVLKGFVQLINTESGQGY